MHPCCKRWMLCVCVGRLLFVLTHCWYLSLSVCVCVCVCVSGQRYYRRGRGGGSCHWCVQGKKAQLHSYLDVTRTHTHYMHPNLLCLYTLSPLTVTPCRYGAKHTLIFSHIDWTMSAHTCNLSYGVTLFFFLCNPKVSVLCHEKHPYPKTDLSDTHTHTHLHTESAEVDEGQRGQLCSVYL